MRRERKLVSILCVLLLLGGLSAGCGTGSTAGTELEIAVIAKSTTSNFWKTVEQGVNTAASEYNVTVTFEGADNEEDYEKQIEMVQQAVKDRVDAIVISAIDGEKLAEPVEEARRQGIHVVVIDSGVDSKMVESAIETDNYAAGGLMAEAVRKNEGNEINIGLVNFDARAQNGQEREQGFIDAVGEDERVHIIEGIHVDSNIASANEGTKKLLEEHPEINMIVTFNEWTTLGVGYAIQESALSVKVQVIGFDNNLISVGMLETGEMDGLVVQNPFSMGYLGIENAYKLIKKKYVEKNIYTDTTMVEQENMYDMDIQKILFPLDSKK